MLLEEEKEIDILKYRRFLVLSCFALTAISCGWHFLWDYTGKFFLIGMFFPINESVWEHGKIILNPLICWTFIEYYYMKPIDLKKFVYVKAYTMVYGLLFMYAFYYTYTGIIGEGILIVDICLALFSMCYAMFLSYEGYTGKINKIHSNICLVTSIIMEILFIVFTFVPPHLPFFWCTVTKRYSADMNYF